MKNGQIKTKHTQHNLECCWRKRHRNLAPKLHIKKNTTLKKEKQERRDVATQTNYQWGKVFYFPNCSRRGKEQMKRIGRKPLCPGIWTWSCRPGIWRQQSCRRNSSNLVLRLAWIVAFQQVKTQQLDSAVLYGVVSLTDLGTRKYFRPSCMLYLWQSTV